MIGDHKMAILHIIFFELMRQIKKIGSLISLLFFFIMAVSLFPFGIGVEDNIISKIAPGILWVCVLLSSLMATSGLFSEDYEDGTLAQLILTGTITEFIVLSKMISHWIVTSLPIIIITPIAAELLKLDGEKIYDILIALLVGTPAITAISSIGASLTLGLSRNQALISLIILPLYIPFLIFGVGALENESAISLLLGITLLVFIISIFASSSAVRNAIEEG